MLLALADGDVQFIVCGGIAMALHGSNHVTLDLDVLVHGERANLARLAAVVSPWRPVFRDVPGDVAVPLPETMASGVDVVTTTTQLGDLDLFVRMAGIGVYADAVEGTSRVGVDGRELRYLSLPQLLAAKRAAGRPKDIAHIFELEALNRLREVARDDASDAR